ncbi:MAG: degP [Acidobacteria bacterium]|nr:degP [Acidobacteriota bacterium]
MNRRFALITIALASVIAFLTGLNAAGWLQGPEPPVSIPPRALPGPGPVVRLATAGAVDFADIAERVNPAVVNIDATSRQRSRRGGILPPDLFGEPDRGGDLPELPQRGAGSGFIIDTEGHILTNHHVVEGAERITVKLADGRSVRAHLVGADPDTDIALVKIDADGQLPVAVLGDSSRLRVGDWVCAIGNPLGYEHTLTVGVVSYKGRKLFDPSLDNYIQTDAAINFGNSGGPLLNARGEVVGINAAVSARASSIGFAVPINTAAGSLDQLKHRGRVVRGYIGVTLREVDPDLQESLGLPSRAGALVEDVAPMSPAERAGIRTYDMIVSIGERPIATNDDLIRTVSSYEPGSAVRLRLLRDGRALDVPVKLAERPGRGPSEDAAEVSSDGPPAWPGAAIGLDVRDLERDIGRRLGLKAGTHGALVVHVEPLSPAYDAEIRRGSVILEINRREVASAADYRRVAARARPGDVLTFLVHIPSGSRALRTVRVER